ncbi:MAG: 50S ribosomal protein L32 [Candidatus Omnitrophica bacterium]|nr:50S ribosomal protein L32 [Candidatus Omnitrophota bacterium]
MPNPKRQHSKQRQRKRRTHYKITLSGLSACSNCKKPVLSHRVCPFCGFYKGKPVIVAKEKKEKETKS